MPDGLIRREPGKEEETERGRKGIWGFNQG